MSLKTVRLKKAWKEIKHLCVEYETNIAAVKETKTNLKKKLLINKKIFKTDRKKFEELYNWKGVIDKDI